MSRSHRPEDHTDIVDAPDLFTSTGTGRATVDERGNSVWEWQTAPGIYSRDISAEQFQALQAPHLTLVEHSEHGTLHHLSAHRLYSDRPLTGRATGVRRDSRQGMLERPAVRVTRRS